MTFTPAHLPNAGNNGQTYNHAIETSLKKTGDANITKQN